MKLIAILIIGCWFLIAAAPVNSQKIGFVEDFALAEDRAEALKQLVPGTTEYYFYSCLHAQHTGDFAKVHELLKNWIKREGYTAQTNEILNRQALLEYQQDPKKSLEHIRKTLDLRFNHQRETADRRTDYPTSLDPELISRSRFIQTAFSRYRNLQGVEDAGLYALPIGQLDPERRRDLLNRLRRPDIPNLPELVVADLKHKHSGGFGAHPIHSDLLKDQLDECLRLMPGLRDNSRFIQVYLTKLAPSGDVDLKSNFEERRAHLDRMWAFVKDLAPAHNSLKVHVLYGILEDERRRGRYEAARDLFMTYIQLPRRVQYIDPDYIRRREFRNREADLNADFSSATRMPPIGSDDALVRDYLAHYFVEAKDFKSFVKYIRDDYLQGIFVETKIVNGVGDMEQWYSLMDPNQYRRLKERVDLAFAHTNPRFFTRGEPVSLDLFVKNVETLIVKIFELNTFNYFTDRKEDVDTAINLDGLSATWERTETYDAPPLRRVRRHFEFPEIDAPGVYVVEFIGNGRSSRAVIRKGKLFFTETIGPAGHEFRIYDELNRHRPGATLWLSGREYAPESDGAIIVPFSTHPKDQKVVLREGNLCSLARFQHQAERYRLSAGFYVDRESLLKGMRAKVLVRPELTVNGHPAALSLLEGVRLSVESTDGDGVSTTQEVSDFALHEDRESVHEFQVPEDLAALRFVMKAEIQNISQNEKQPLSAEYGCKINEIDATLHVHDLFLGRDGDSHVVHVLGKNGEPAAGRPVQFDFKHRYFREPAHAVLQTDDKGRIRLGRLDGINQVTARGPGDISRTWPLLADRSQMPQVLHGQAGEALQLPYAKDGIDGLTLLEIRMTTFAADRTDALSVGNGFLRMAGLAPGDYALFFRDEGRRIDIRVTAGEETDGVVLSDSRVLEASPGNPLSISGAKVSDKAIDVFLGNATPSARLHVFAVRMTPAFDPFSGLRSVGLPTPYVFRPARPESQYVAGRDIGDEYRYILDRQYARKFPGNMLRRPELLLNPWEVRKTETATDQAGAGTAYESERPSADAMVREPGAQGRGEGAASDFSNLDFLARSSAILVNLKPDKDGRVKIGREEIGDRSQILLVAVDPLSTVYREVALPATEIARRDLRLRDKLDPKVHFTEQKEISVVPAGETLRISDIATAEFEVFDALGKVYRLMATLSGDATLEKFSFILRWPDMDDAEKADKYAEFACHELNFFLFHKDRPFFDRVIRPYLGNKKDKTFMDHWLLGADMGAYLEPWAFSRLNIVEKILLARGGPDDHGRIGRFVKELFEMIPPDVERFNLAFDTALRGSALEGDAFGFDDLKEALRDKAGEGAMDELDYAMDMEMEEAAPAETTRGDFQGAAKAMIQALPSAAPPPAPATGRAFKKRARREVREKARPFFRKLDKTKEWAENNYYHLPIAEQDADLITVNGFWKEYALSDTEAPFFSEAFPEAVSSFAEMMLALSVLDLPFEAKTHETDADDRAFSLTAGSPLIAFHQEIRPAPAAETPLPMMVTQRYFRPDDRYRYEGNERFDKFVSGEFLLQTPYGCQVVLSNPTSSRRKLRLMLRIPMGAMPLKEGFYTEGEHVTLEPYATETYEYHFYFPATGTFGHYPVQAALNEAFVAGAEPSNLNAVARLTKIDTESWAYVSQNGDSEQVLAYMRSHNLNRINLPKVAFRMKDRTFFDAALDLLRFRHVYDHTLWSYGIHHGAEPAIREFLEHSEYANQVGYAIDTALLTVDPVERKIYQHLEYRPLVNARAHTLGDERKILNDRFNEQYHEFMVVLSYRPRLDDADLTAAVYYLLLQDRVAEAISFFGGIDPKRLATRLQYDYLQTYIDFYTGDLDRARRTVAAYADYPVPRWRNFFRQAGDQLAEMEGGAATVADDKDRDQVQAQLAATAPNLEFSVEARRITIRYRNIDECLIRYYPMDIELLFSRNPFVEGGADHFGYIRPSETETVALPPGGSVHTVDLPEQYRSSNLMIEVTAAGIQKSQTYYANALDVRIIGDYGHLQAAHDPTRKPLPMTYVKVYARMRNGEVRFYKDGYTDLRGRFDFVSLSTDELDSVDKFAILVLNEEHGAVIREAEPPKR